MTVEATGIRLTHRELESTLWATANALRSPVDPGDFKVYVFPIMFFKWISDNWDYCHAQALAEWGDELTDGIEYSDYQPFVVPKGCHWADVHATTYNLGNKVAAVPPAGRLGNGHDLADDCGHSRAVKRSTARDCGAQLAVIRDPVDRSLPPRGPRPVGDALVCDSQRALPCMLWASTR